MPLKDLASTVPGGLFAGYLAKTFWRQSVVDRLVTRRHRRRHPEAAAVRSAALELDREGCVVMRDLFDGSTLATFVHECGVVADRVGRGAIDQRDLRLAPGGSYRVTWRSHYGETVERQFFGHPFFEAVARFYLGGPVKHVYKIFQRSYPREDKGFFGAGEHFHFDYERRTFKAFLYLTNVAPENGPLVYCPGTAGLTVHKLAKIARMHVRGTNQELACSAREAERLRLRERAVPLIGVAGTVLLADTRGYHKAGAIAEGVRDVLVVYYGRA